MPCDFDIIGDTHGHVEPLIQLLTRLGYHDDGISYVHPCRRALFLGDYIDGGPEQIAVLMIVRRMVDAGRALALMGNHEFNAIGWATRGSNGDYLRPHTVKNLGQHRAFLDAVVEGSNQHHEWIQWFMTLPLWVEFPNLRAVHACWSPRDQRVLSRYLTSSNCLNPEHLDICYQKGTDAFDSVEIVLKGPEVDLPPGVSFSDKYNIVRHRSRIKWWLDGPRLADRLAAPQSLLEQIRQLERSEGRVFVLDAPLDWSTDRPTFVGHYWLTGSPAPLSRLVACLDYSVARNGKLVAYRFQGETQLCARQFVSHTGCDGVGMGDLK